MDVLSAAPMSDYRPPAAAEEAAPGEQVSEDEAAPAGEGLEAEESVPQDTSALSEDAQAELAAETPAEDQGQTAESSQDSGPSAGDVATRPLQNGAQWTEALAEAQSKGTSAAGRASKLLGPAAGLVGDTLSMPGKVQDAAGSISKAWETGAKDDVAKAVADTTSVASTGTNMAKQALQVPEAIVKGKAEKAAAEAFRKAAPNASQEVIEAASKKAAESAINDSTSKAARRGTAQAARQAAQSGGSTLARGAGASKEVAKGLLREGGEAAAKAASKAVAKGAMKTAAKAAGRFVPGANVAIAALDTANAVATFNDDKASAGKKFFAGATAAGSILAATNIPVVSQVGAAVSTLTSFLGSWW